MDNVVGAQLWMLNKIGERMAEKITMGKHGDYLVDNEMKNYLVKWTSDPWIVKDVLWKRTEVWQERENGFAKDFG